MSNLQKTIRLPLQTSMTNKSKSRALTNDLLERKTRALEGSLNKLKLTIQRDQTKPTAETHRRVWNKEMPQYPNSRDKPAVNAFSTKPSTIKQLIKCGQCEKEEAKMKCLECVEMYCATCFTHFHLRGALQRHRCILISTSEKKKQFPTPEPSPRQSHDDLHRITTIKSTIYDESGESLSNKRNLVSFQQSFLQWRENKINKSQQIQQKRGLISPTMNRREYTNKLPYIELNSSRSTSDENLLLKKYQHTNQEIAIQRLQGTHFIKKDQSKIGVIHYSLSDSINLNDQSVDTDTLNDNLSTTRTAESEETITIEENSNNDNNLEQERPVTHVSMKSFSRPTSSSMKKDLISSRPNSTTIFQPSLRSVLATKSTDELEAIIDSRLILSRPTSEKLNQPSNWTPQQSASSNVDIQTIVIDQYTITQFDSTLEDLFDEKKIELAYRLNYLSETVPPIISARDQSSTHVFSINSTMTTPRRHSPFSFTNSLYKTSRINSSSSRDTGDGGFFTDVLPRQIIASPIPPPPLPPPPPPPILECSSSNEWKHTLENQPNEDHQVMPEFISLPKLFIRSLSRTSSKHSITQEETPHRSKSQTDNNSRPGSSLSSASLPVSVTSSKHDFIDSKVQSPATSSTKDSSASTSESSTSATTTTTTAESSSSATTTTNTSSSSTSTLKPTIRNSSPQPETTLPMIIEEKKATSLRDTDECLQESTNLISDKSSSNIQASQSMNDLTKSDLTTCLTRDEHITVNDIPAKKRTRRPRRQSPTSDEFSKLRKLEFSMGVGLKWQEASLASMSSTETICSNSSSNATTPRSLTPSNPVKLAEQFSVYDNDDGRSSRTYQNVNDDECFNQLHQELCSDLDMRGSDEDAILNEHILNILQGVQMPFNEKDVIMIETKLRQNETVHQPSMDNDLLIHE